MLVKRAIFLFLPFVLLAGCTNPIASKAPKPTPVTNDETKAVLAAKALYDQTYGKLSPEEQKTQLAAGPCLSEDIMPDWVADIAHQPRIAADDDPKNQCQNFRTGKAHHFVELDEYGNYLRAF